MAEYPFLIGITCSNKPTAAQNYEHSTTPLTGMLSPNDANHPLTNGRTYTILARAEDANGNASGTFEICDAVWNDAATDNFSGRTLRASSSGSLIDWSTATGTDETPVVRVIAEVPGLGRYLHTAGTLSGGESYITIGGATNAFKDGYDYEIEFLNVANGTDNVAIRGEVYDSDATAWDSTGPYQSYAGGSYASTVVQTSTSTTYFLLHQSNLTHDNLNNWSARVWVIAPASDTMTLIKANMWFRFNNLGDAISTCVSRGADGQTVTGVRVYPSSGTFSSGSYRCWGIPR